MEQHEKRNDVPVDAPVFIFKRLVTESNHCTVNWQRNNMLGIELKGKKSTLSLLDC